MPFREVFFDDPLLRLTPPSELNDPFDSKASQAAIDKKMEFFFSGIDGLDEPETNSVEIRSTYESNLRTNLNNFGIISLSEDPYNLLMWSHYAEEHKGMVVSIACDTSTFEYHGLFTETCKISKKEPVKVIYSNSRPGYEMPENTIYEYFEDNFYNHIATIKGDSWFYEKEHRYLLSLLEADSAIVDVHSDLSNIKDPDIRLTHLYGNTYKIDAYLTEKCSIIPWHIALCQGRKDVSNVKLFKRLSKSSVRGFYFGSRVSKKNIIEAINKIKNNPLFGDSIKFYRSIENPNFFEINFEQVM